MAEKKTIRRNLVLKEYETRETPAGKPVVFSVRFVKKKGIFPCRVTDYYEKGNEILERVKDKELLRVASPGPHESFFPKQCAITANTRLRGRHLVQILSTPLPPHFYLTQNRFFSLMVHGTRYI